MRQFSAYLKTSIMAAISYRGDVLLFVLGGVSQPLVILALWLGVAYSGGTLSLTTNELIQYYLFVVLIGYFTSTWASQFITKDIRQGDMSRYLLKPTNFLFFQASNNIGEKIVKGAYILPLLIVLGIFFKVPIPIITIFKVVLFFFSLVSACIISFIADMCVGVAGFWFESTEALDDFYGIGSSMLSGRMIPLSIFPSLFLPFINILPFRYLLSFPIEIIQNKLDSQQILVGLSFQLFWLFAFFLLYRTLWTKGLHRYSAVGA